MPRALLPFLLGSVVLLAACSDRPTPVQPLAPSDAALAGGRPAAPVRASRGRPVPDQYIVQFNDDVRDPRGLATGLVQAGGGRLLHVYQRAIRGFAARLPAPAVEALRRNPNVRRIEQDWEFTLRGTVTQQASPHWGLDRIDQRHRSLDDSYSYSEDGAGVDIYILDSGVRFTHGEFGGRAVNGADFVDDGQNGVDCYGHGTGVASSAAGATVGSAKNATIVSVRIADCSGSGYGSNALAGVEWVAANRDPARPSIANLSFGGEATGEPTATEVAIKNTFDAGILFVGATANEFVEGCDDFPTRTAGVLSVGRTNSSDEMVFKTGYGPCLDLLAPGQNVGVAGIASDAELTTSSGTSFATPTVAGVAARLWQRHPSWTPQQVTDQVLADATPDVILIMTDGYATPEGTTSRLLFAPIDNAPPVASAGGPYAGDEGGVIALFANATTDADGDPLTYAWDFGDGQTGSGVSPVHRYRDNGTYTATVTVSDGFHSVQASATVTIVNVAPTLTLNPAQVKSGIENSTITVSATFVDPGVNDAPFVGEVTCYTGSYGTLKPATTANSAVVAGERRGVVSATCPYGDDGTFAVSVRVADKDGAHDTEGFAVTIANVAPTVAISGVNATMINGQPTIITSVGAPTPFQATVTDPGSDDLALTWDWQDGTTSSATSLNAPPLADGDPSPSVNARSFVNPQSKTFAAACLRQVSLAASDDDAGSGSATIAVVVAGTSRRARTSGYWQTQYRQVRSSPVGEAALTCYLQIASHLSAVFDERRAAGTFAQAAGVLQGGGSDMARILEQQLLAAWINFADGAWTWGQLVDTTGDGVPDVTFGAAILAAEAVRLDPAATRAALEAQKNVLERLNASGS